MRITRAILGAPLLAGSLLAPLARAQVERYRR